MKEFETEYIEKLIGIMKNNELTEVTLEDDDKSLVIKSNGFKAVIKEKEAEETVTEEQEIIEAAVEEEEAPKKNLIPIVSTMIGLYYSKPSPDAEPFVKVGDKIKAGEVVCLIETIKLMNKIKSDISGRVAEICIENGKPVEYDQVIMYIEKD